MTCPARHLGQSRMSVGLAQLVLVTITLVFLCLQLGLKKEITWSVRSITSVMKDKLQTNNDDTLDNASDLMSSMIQDNGESQQNMDPVELHMETERNKSALQLNSQLSAVASDDYDVDTKHRLANSRQNVVQVCQSDGYKTSRGRIKYQSYAFGRLRWCSIPKSGTTFLSREVRPTLKVAGEGGVVEGGRKRGGEGGKDNPSPKSFVLVREPYSRLVSAYFSKIVGHPGWWEGFGAKIISKFRPSASAESKQCGHDVTFREFIKFFIYSHDHKWATNAHFMPMTSVCNVCADIPDFIGKLETVREDMRFILHSVNITGDTGKPFIEVKHLAELFMSFKPKIQHCAPMCDLISRFWWGQQATGLIDRRINFPLTGDMCDQINGEQLASIAWDAHIRSSKSITKHQQKRDVSAKLWQEITMEDRLQVRRILTPDCQLFGYDPSPEVVFPKNAVS